MKCFLLTMGVMSMLPLASVSAADQTPDKRYCFCAPIEQQKIPEIREHYLNVQESVQENGTPDSWLATGMKSFSAWIQTGEAGTYLVRCIEGQSLDQMYARTRELLAQGDPKAIWLRDWLLEMTGEDYADPSCDPQLEEAFDLVYGDHPVGHREVFVYPLLAGKEEDHQAFAREVSEGELAMLSERACRAYGLHHLQRWVQRTPSGTYLITLEEEADADFDPDEAFRQLDGNPDWKVFSARHQNLTGLSEEGFNPTCELIFSHSIRE